MINIPFTILALYPNVVTVTGDIAYDKDEQVVQYDMAKVEEKLAELQAVEAAKEQSAKDAKASALDKLSKLGLTADEVKALLG